MAKTVNSKTSKLFMQCSDCYAGLSFDAYRGDEEECDEGVPRGTSQVATRERRLWRRAGTRP